MKKRDQPLTLEMINEKSEPCRRKYIAVVYEAFGLVDLRSSFDVVAVFDHNATVSTHQPDMAPSATVVLMQHSLVEMRKWTAFVNNSNYLMTLMECCYPEVHLTVRRRTLLLPHLKSLIAECAQNNALSYCDMNSSLL